MRGVLSALTIAALVACGPSGVIEDETELGEEEVAAMPSALFLGDPKNHAPFALDVSHWEGPIGQHEMDCSWSSGVRHIISGTQVKEITRQQLAMALSRGMTADAYVYLYWDKNLAAQVQKALDRVEGFPLGRLWLDVEQDPEGRSASDLIDRVQQAVDACRAQTKVACGIYTGPGFWRSYMGNTPRFADLPLWYAQYNRKASLSEWATEKFGGWDRPTGKQYIEEVICGVGADKNVMQVATSPLVVVDRTPHPVPTAPPSAPGGLFPEDGATVTVDYARLMAAPVPHATSHELQLEVSSGASFVPYHTWTRVAPAVKANPAFRDRRYRFRARAKNGFGWGAWSAYATFDFGSPSGARPDGPSASLAAPSSLRPDGMTVGQSGVTLSCGALSGASRYAFAIDLLRKGAFEPYATYSTASPSKTFWPQSGNSTYRFKVRAEAGSSQGPWSRFAEFKVR